ncbi:MAG: thioredoxin-disulfide reductase [Clostridia bacterium]|nr:thioredoxin-disulfide reductase [Clostridia bacterium]
MDKLYDVIIIGGGPAGYTAALYSARAGLSTLVLEKMAVGGQMALTGDIDNYPGFEQGIDGFTLGMKMQQSAERFGAKTEYDEVVSVDFTEKIKKIKAVMGEYEAKTVIIATGANPKKLGLENEDALTGMGIHYCAHCDGRFYKDKTVAVVGGGNSAVSDALYLSNLAKKVYLIHRRDTLKATQVYKAPLEKAENIEFLWNTALTSVIFDQKVIGAEIKNLKSNQTNGLALDGVFISIGRKPASELFDGVLNLDEYGYIVADETTKTNIDGVYAIGDVRTKPLRQVVTAVGDGATAVHFAEEHIHNF